MAIPRKTVRYTEEEYLRMEETSPERNEFHDGEIFAMSGNSVEHSLIVSNTIAELNLRLRDKPCLVFDSNLKVQIEQTRSYLYPDVTVICGEIQRDEKSRHVIKNPSLLIEVISESTGAWDRGGKFHLYQQIASFREYVLLEQNSPRADVFFRNDSGEWTFNSYHGLSSIIEFRSISLQVPIETIYRNVSFPG